MAKSDFKFFYPIRVRYAETDLQGIVFNAHYLTYFDTAIYEYLRDLPFECCQSFDRILRSESL
jgi:acyl-CoA thioester hydrolase